MGALAVPPLKRAPPGGSSEGEEEQEASDLTRDHKIEGPPEGVPLFLPPHVLTTLCLTPGESEVEIWGAHEFISGGVAFTFVYNYYLYYLLYIYYTYYIYNCFVCR